MIEHFPVHASDYPGAVLVTGAGGCIGSWVLALLVRNGIPAVAFDLTEDRRRPGLLLDAEELARVRWLIGDVSDTQRVLEAVRTSDACAIVHLAGLQVPFCKADPVAGARVNVVGTVNIFEAARAQGIRRVAYASSIGALGAFPDSPWGATLYGAYKYCNEQTAKVYWRDWQVPSVGFRPGVVYGVGRDQGQTSKTTVAMLAAVAGQPYDIPFRGPVSWLHAGEVASAFLKAVSRDGDDAPVFDINGPCLSVEEGVALLRQLVPGAQVGCSGAPLPYPMDLSDEPLRAHVGDYGQATVEQGMRATIDAFRGLLARGALEPPR
ncbi:MAG: NAD-dependent epimerase/dehydratase family protein [Betaproteobacteria bacterium]|jgi:nucleoside-diphosphate-sugar epimerase|nr:SDR family oxidoreductase [Rhodocyclaceae bacterium]MCE2899441.1 SDR family oxidoreductase [Betaproteobacteria bacterium]